MCSARGETLASQMTKISQNSGWRREDQLLSLILVSNQTIDSYCGSWKGCIGRKWAGGQSETSDPLLIRQERRPSTLILAIQITE
jgi:hypothetical protein